MFLFGAARTAGEVLGIVDELVEEVVEDQDDTSQDIKPIELKNITVKTVGNVQPYLVDPQKDLEALIELFGVSKGVTKVMSLQCPDCDYESDVEQENVALEDDCSCSACGYEGEFSEFFEGTETKVLMSRTPSDLDILLAAGRTTDLDNVHPARVASMRDGLRNYYEVLLGHRAVVPDEAKEYGVRDAGIIDGRYRVHCRGCSGSCTCNNDNMYYYGKVHSLQAQQALLAEQEEDS